MFQNGEIRVSQLAIALKLCNRLSDSVITSTRTNRLYGHILTFPDSRNNLGFCMVDILFFANTYILENIFISLFRFVFYSYNNPYRTSNAIMFFETHVGMMWHSVVWRLHIFELSRTSCSSNPLLVEPTKGVRESTGTTTMINNNPYSKVYGANMGSTGGRQDPGGPYVCPVNIAIWEAIICEGPSQYRLSCGVKFNVVYVNRRQSIDFKIS